MVLHRRIADSTVVSSRSTFRQMTLETGTSVGRRWTSRLVGSVNGLPGTRLPTSTEPTTHQKVRRILEEHTWKRSSQKKSTNGSLSNYNIVASRGELCSGSFSVRESSGDGGCAVKRRKSPVREGLVSDERELVGGIGRNNDWDRKRDIDRSGSKVRNIKAIHKTPSLPANLKEGFAVGSPTNAPHEGILKKSSAFFEKITKDKKEAKSPGIKSASQLTAELTGLGESLRKPPSCRRLNARPHSRINEKKSVSFSTDTSFGVKKNSPGKIVIHEAKVYRKGVLRDIHNIDNLREPEESVEQGMSLLRAAREADELALNDLVTRIQRLGLGKIDVNATDSSGRSVISYMAGNGAADLLETMLSFPGANPNVADNEGHTPLHFAAQAGQAECLNILLQRSTEIELDARNILGFTPLMKAAIQGRTKCAKILIFAGANPSLRDHGRGLRADQWARFCGRHVCSDIIERFSRHKIIERRSSSCRWGSEPELATKVLQGKITPVQIAAPASCTGLKSRIKRVFRTTTGQDKSFSLVSQLTSAALCASTPALPKPGDIPSVKSIPRPLSVPQLRITLAAPIETNDKCDIIFTDKIESTMKSTRIKKKNK